MHIADLDKGMLGANGIVGGGYPLACGSALTAKLKKTNAVSVCFFGDGANNQGTGLIPAGLMEEIRALGQPPISWDVELARWFDDHFTPMEKRRTFSRMSRRQFSTPDIPRPAWAYQQTDLEGRTFGVVLDTGIAQLFTRYFTRTFNRT